ncbi:hypothetical protein ADL22_05180 [Streptomyces sp. NRRL F-4489]|nr:hypothetical protein ADL22_05180 [Streptomyces sp. NRRL F-4489]
MLGFLLFHANRVVSTSALLEALWPADEAPNSARKILHNAVWGLRGSLASTDEGAGRASLITRPPGYLLQLDPESVDLYRFHRLAKEGRARLADGAPGAAADVLRRALGLWRGHILADLAEAGFCWPELAGVENARVDALEDYFEAELALGRHHSVLREIESAVEAGTLRERLCGQLMLALYRCGRHTDALGAYNRLRERLVDELGLEPGNRLQTLQQAILRHDDTLLAPEAAPAARPPEVPRPADAPRPRHPGGPRPAAVVRRHPVAAAAPAAPPPVRETRPAPLAAASGMDGGPGILVAAPAPAPGPAPAVGSGTHSVLMVQTTFDDRCASPDTPAVESGLAAVADALRDAAEHLDGTVAAPAGPALVAVFTGDRAAERATSAALVLLTCVPSPPAGNRPPVGVRAAVATGEAVLYRIGAEPDSPAMVLGSAADTCRTLLTRAAAGTARACPVTREQARDTVCFCRCGSSATGWQVRSAHWRSLAHPCVPVIDRDYELDVLGSLLGRSRYRSVPQLVTLLGGVGTGKTRLALEFERRAMARWDDVRFLTTGPDCADRPLGLLRDLLFALCDAPLTTETATVAGLLRQQVYAYIADPEEAAEADACVTELITTGGHGPAPHRHGPLLAGGISLLRAVAIDHPLVIFVDDGHELDDAGLDFLERLVGSAEPPALMVVLAARPQLLGRRPGWGGGQAQGAVLTLDPLSDAALDRLCDIMIARMRRELLTFPTTRLGAGFGEQVLPSARRRALRTLMRMDSALPPRRSLGDARVRHEEPLVACVEQPAGRRPVCDDRAHA